MKIALRIVITIVIMAYFIGYSLLSNEIKSLNCKSEYTYVDENGNKGTSKHCFNSGKGLICRDIKHSFRVKSAKEKRVCE
jgi:hypothetical protein